MKFRKYGRVFDIDEAVIEYCRDKKCLDCKMHKDGRVCALYAITNPKEAACLMDYEVIEDDTPTVAETVEENSEDAKPDLVNRPAHYTSGGIECIDAMQAAFGAEAVKDFCLCNAFKYLWRHRNKNGVEDLKKARWYLNRLITEMEVTDDDT
nr:MAG TPA: nucelotide kinase [Caudoviricetes sp.]